MAPARLAVRTATRCGPGSSVPVENTRFFGMARHGPASTRYRWVTVPSAALACGAATWKYSSAEVVSRSGVPLTNAVAGAWFRG